MSPCSFKAAIFLLFLISLLTVPQCQGLEDDEAVIEVVPESPTMYDPEILSNVEEPDLGDSKLADSEISEPNDLTNDVNEDVVDTPSGPVIGTTSKSSDGKEVNVYYGIPYAASPTGPLRFRPPEKVSPWSTPLKALDRHYICYQHLSFSAKVVGMEYLKQLLARPWSENCLKLTIWAPKPKASGAPVLAYIHGGAFILGSSLMFTDGADLAASGVVVIGFNYRVGVFGFFDLGRPEAPGNVGLMDQTLALQWIQENVEAFGGDPKKVTLLGESAGSASVGYHLLSPMSKGLFSAAILIGGAPANPWALKEPEQAVQTSNKLLESLGCSNSNASLALDCIRQRDAEDVLEHATLSMELLSNENFVPTVDGEFLKEHPFVSLEAGRIASPVPLLVSTAEKEGSMFMVVHLSHPDGRTTRSDFERVVRAVDGRLTQHQAKLLQVFYTNWSQPDDPYLLRDAAVALYGDYFVVCDVNRLVDSMAKAGVPVYRYVFDHVSPSALFMFQEWTLPTHCGEHGMLMSSQAMLGQDATEIYTVRKIRQHFLSFLTARDPNLNKADFPEEPKWPLYKPLGKQILRFAARSRLEAGHRDRECRFLREIVATQKC